MKHAMVLSALSAVGLLCAAGSAQVVISQVYGGGGNSGAQFNQDFIELKNIGTTPVDITGWTVQEASAGATGSTGNFSTAGRATAPFPSRILQPGQYYLVGGSFGTNTALTALPTPDITATNITVAATNGKVVLVNNSTLVSITNPAYFDQTTFNPVYGAGSPIVDMVGFGNVSGSSASHFEGSGPTLPASNSTAVVRLNNGCQDTNDNFNDFTVAAPSPHNSTSTIPCGATFPDLSLTLINSACNPTVGSSYDVTATVANTVGVAASNTTVTLVLPPTLNYTSSNTGGVGSVSYNPVTRTLTWNVGTLGSGASAGLTVTSAVVAEGGVVVTGTSSTTTANEPTANNSAVSYSEVLSTAAPLGVIAVASSTDTSIATSVFESIGGFSIERKLGTIYRTFTSQDGNWIIFRADLAGLTSTDNGAIIVGHNTGSGWSFEMVAHESISAPIAGQPTWFIDGNTFGNVQGINNNGEYVYSARLRDMMGTSSDNTDDVLHWVVVKGTVAGGVSSVIKGGDTNHAGNVDADAATAPELAGRNYISLGDSTIQNDGTVSFWATLSGTSSTNAVFLKSSGATVLAQKGVTIPGGSTFAWSSLDRDDSSDGNGLFVSANGATWLGTGAINSGDTATDNVVVVNGTIAVREGSPVGTFTDPAGWATFGSQQVPWSQMLPDGSWYIHGYNPATAGFNQGQDWVNRQGVIVAATGQSIFGSNAETWADNILQRTFFLEAGAGDAYAVGGLTNRSLAVNGSDDTSDGVVVYRSSQVLVREGNPVTIAEGDTRYLNLINDNRGFIAGNKLFMAATLRSATSECTRNFAGLPQALVAVPLPTTNPCPADVGVQGGGAGSDGVLDNNDFIAFITLFFNHDTRADMGIQGGLPGSDGAFDNNDFIAFINHFFAGCGH